MCMGVRAGAICAVCMKHRAMLAPDSMSVTAAHEFAAIYTRLAIPPFKRLITNGTEFLIIHKLHCSILLWSKYVTIES